jgi:hypothetical protein
VAASQHRSDTCWLLLLLLYVCARVFAYAQAKDLPIGELVQKATMKKVLLSEQKVREVTCCRQGRAGAGVVLASAVQALCGHNASAGLQQGP